MIDMKQTGQWIRFLCKREHVTVAELQKHLRIASNQAIYAWFNGKALPSLDNMCALGHVLRMPMDDLLVLKGMKHPFMKRMKREEQRMVAYAYKFVIRVS